MKKKVAALSLLVVGLWLALQLTDQMRHRPLVVKLGYPTEANILKSVSGEHRYLVAEGMVLKVLFYFGGLVDLWKRQIALPPEYFNMFKSLETAIQLDPYNADAYYFVQGVFTWDVGRAQDVNRLLDYGMRYRTWDPMLPFFAGFNASYFLHDYEQAAMYMQRAAEMSGNPGMAKLASRYYLEAGRVEAGLRFLDQMIETAPTTNEADQYRLRKQALMATQQIRDAVTAYQERFGRVPDQLSTLIDEGILSELPTDPYGGRYQLDKSGKVFARRPVPESPVDDGRGTGSYGISN